MSRQPRGEHSTEVHLDVQTRTARVARAVEEPSFHVALLGDFGGRGSVAVPPDRLDPVGVDRDEVDALLARFAPTLRVAGGGNGGATLEATFRELEDFHPDRLVERVALFRSIREAGGAAGSRPAPRRSGGSGPGPAPVEEMLSGSVLDRIVEGEENGGDRGGSRHREDPLQSWVDEVVRPHLEREPDPGDEREADLVATLLADGMRELLRHPGFRRIESLWRGVDFLVRRVETGPRLTVHLVDVTPGALAADAEDRAFADLLRRGAGPRGEPWSVVAATWSVGPAPDDLTLLRRLARRAAGAGAVLLAGAEPSLAGLPGLEAAGDRGAWGEPDRLWAAFRREPEARAVGVALPRFLLRLPYGEATDPCAALELEEIGDAPSPGDYLWGPAVLPLVLVLARAFERAGAGLADAVEPEVRGLPLHAYREGGQSLATPCTEVALTRDDADRMMGAGIMPWAWHRGDDGIRLVRLQSAADPLAALSGWWRG